MTKTEQINKALDHLDMMRVNLLALRAVIEVPDEKTPLETEGEIIIHEDRLDPIWNKLCGFMSSGRHLTLRRWAYEKLGYRFYVSYQKQPVDLCTHIRDKLCDLNEERLTELEAILE